MKFEIVKPSKLQINEEYKNWRFRSEEKECLLCHSLFSYGFQKTKICGLCKLRVKCDLCEKEFEYNFTTSGRGYYFDKKLIESILNNNYQNINLYCPECLKNSNPGLCSICGIKNDSRDKANRGRSNCQCSSNWYKKHNSSEKMKLVSGKNAKKYLVPIILAYQNGGKCNKCGTYNQKLDTTGLGITNCTCSKNKFKRISKILAKNAKAPGICRRCKKDTREYKGNKNRTIFGVCIPCQLKINSSSGFGNQYFIEKNFLTYYYDKSVHNYVLWEDFKAKFRKRLETNSDFIEKISKFYPNFKIIPTFRSQDSNSWNGSKSAFEQSLIDQNITWFTYIKFYISHQNEIKPLVVGKSGSLLVNARGSDVNFSENEDDGPARRFLIEENLNWDKTKILIIPCESEQEALDVEKKLQKEFNLFGS